MTSSHPSQLTLTKADAGLKLTAEEFAEADFQKPYRYERANGKLVVMPAHDFWQHELRSLLLDHLVPFHLEHPEIR